jgi:hypothetical protein
VDGLIVLKAQESDVKGCEQINGRELQNEKHDEQRI